MEFSLFTLTLGSFLMALPYLSEAVTLDITMNTYSTINARFEVACKFSAEVDTYRVTLLHGGIKTLASYSMTDSNFRIPSNNKITLNVKTGATVRGGELTFVFSRLDCSDFTWYMCQIEDPSANLISSRNETLKVKPKIDSIDSTPVPTVHQMSTFTCTGSISKEGAFKVIWYQNIFSSDGKLKEEPAKVISETQCHRRIENSLTYNVSEADVPNLKLGCRLDGEQGVDLMQNFTVQGLSTVAPPVTPAAVKAGLEAGTIVGIVLGITALIVLAVLLVWFLVIRPKRLQKDGPSKEQGPEPNAKDYEENMKGQVNPALEDKHDADNAPYTVYPSSKYDVAPGGGHENPALHQDMPNHMSGSTV